MSARLRIQSLGSGPAIGLIGLLAILAWEASGLDLTTARVFADSTGFFFRNHWFFSGVLHEGVRVFAWCALGLLILTAVMPTRFAVSGLLQWRWVTVSVLVAVAVPALKQFSATSCPWSLSEFGGAAAYVPHWMLGVRDGGPGKCFPSGHVVNAFAFLPGWFLYRYRRQGLARVVLVTVLALGVMSGAAQVVRGAHYPSHVFWSAWLCWMLSWAASDLVQQMRLRKQPAPSKPSATHARH